MSRKIRGSREVSTFLILAVSSLAWATSLTTRVKGRRISNSIQGQVNLCITQLAPICLERTTTLTMVTTLQACRNSSSNNSRSRAITSLLKRRIGNQLKGMLGITSIIRIIKVKHQVIRPYSLREMIPTNHLLKSSPKVPRVILIFLELVQSNLPNRIRQLKASQRSSRATWLTWTLARKNHRNKRTFHPISASQRHQSHQVQKWTT